MNYSLVNSKIHFHELLGDLVFEAQCQISVEISQTNSRCFGSSRTLADHRWCTQFHTMRQYTGHRTQDTDHRCTQFHTDREARHCGQYTVAADQGRTLRKIEIPIVVTRWQSGNVKNIELDLMLRCLCCRWIVGKV